jgi:hypothetical protein
VAQGDALRVSKEGVLPVADGGVQPAAERRVLPVAEEGVRAGAPSPSGGRR